MPTPPDQCPTCELPDGAVIATVGRKRWYRCPACLQSWYSTLPEPEED